MAKRYEFVFFFFFSIGCAFSPAGVILDSTMITVTVRLSTLVAKEPW